MHSESKLHASWSWSWLLPLLAAVGLFGCGDDSGGDGGDAGQNNTSVTLCGNGVKEGAEACDNGEQNSDTRADACRSDCTLPRCGDGVKDASELCDDGPRNSDDVPDACRTSCTPPVCGDDVVDVAQGETCDHGGTPTATCGALCQVIFCGNGFQEPGEACDDGNNTPGDGCSANCQSKEVCGNSILDLVEGEECDDGPANSDETPDACRTNCALPSCGDGVTDTGEACDDGNHVSGDGCRADCLSDESCGNGFIDLAADEECDDGGKVPGDGCGATCLIERCGNGYQDLVLGEQCDDGNNVAGDGCSADCLSDETCGNGYVDAVKGEKCDDGNTRSRDGCSSKCNLEWGRWIELQHQPVARDCHAMTHDDARDRTVMFGGKDENDEPLDDTWEFDGTRWSHVVTRFAPAPRYHPALCYHPPSGQTFLFGGRNTGAIFGDTWAFNGKTWSRITTVERPKPAYGSGMAYNPMTGRCTLYGGSEGLAFSAYKAKTWEFDGSQWHLMVPQAPTDNPVGLAVPRMITSPDGDGVLLHGGVNAMPRSKFYRWDGTRWHGGLPEDGDRSNHAVAYNPNAGLLVFYGGGSMAQGQMDDTREFDGTTWSTVPIAVPPPVYWDMAMAYHKGLGKIVLFGGVQSGVLNSDTYVYDGFTWSALPAPDPAPVETRHAMAYDPVGQRVVMFIASQSGQPNGETWEFNGRYWRNLNIAVAPTSRSDHTMAYHAGRGTVFLHAGGDAETWELSGTTWSPVISDHAPPPRTGHAMAYDPRRNAMVTFGGDADETWEYSDGDWQNPQPPTRPGSRTGAVLSYNPKREAVLLWGGYDYPAFYYDVMAYDGTDWALVPEMVGPAGMRQAALALDSRRGINVLYGGTVTEEGGHVSVTTLMDETWENDGLIWIETDPVVAGTPPARFRHAMAYADAFGALVMHGGRSIDYSGSPAWFDRGDTWLYIAEANETAEICGNGVDDDGDTQVDCDDDDCADFCAACGNGTCDPSETCLTCPVDCVSCVPVCGDAACNGSESSCTCPTDCGRCGNCWVRINEVFGGTPDSIEVINTGTCAVDLGDFSLAYRFAGGTGHVDFTFASGTTLPGGGVYRVLDDAGALLPNEVYAGVNINHSVAGFGWVALCEGATCAVAECTNFVDYVEVSGATPPTNPPACAIFHPAPVDTSGFAADDAAGRQHLFGRRYAGRQGDWAGATFSRD